MERNCETLAVAISMIEFCIKETLSRVGPDEGCKELCGMTGWADGVIRLRWTEAWALKRNKLRTLIFISIPLSSERKKTDIKEK